MNKDLERQIAEYEAKHQNIKIAYGGDGTVLAYVKKFPKAAIFPFRNYGLCEKHQDRLQKFLDGSENQKDLKQTLCPYLEVDVNGQVDRGIAEIVVKSYDISTALRFDLFINDKLYMKNVIADGMIVSTKYGSTGYFKSLSRCIFNCEGLGIAFIAPSQGISNLVIDRTSKIKMIFKRDGVISFSADKTVYPQFYVKENEAVKIEEFGGNASIFGLEDFHCQACRTKRHSIYEFGEPIQDQYAL